MRREFLKKIININLISRFFAKQIDLLLIHLISFSLYLYLIKQELEYNPLVVFLPVLLIGTIWEAISIFLFNTTLGKFFLGLRIYPNSLLDSFKRSFLSYIKGLGLGLPVLGWFLMVYQYLTGINQEISWDKYGKVEQKKEDFIMGMISFTIINVLIVLTLALLFIQKQKTVQHEDQTSIEKVVVGYPGINDLDQGISEEEKELWNSSCVLGALGALEYFNYKNLNSEQVELIKLACEQGEDYLEVQEPPETIYMKACGFGIGVGTSLQQGDRQIINFKGKEEEILKRICISPLEN
jgi:hypothetical protein